MFNKDKTKGFIIGVVAAVSAGAMVTALASPVEQAISVVFDNYRIIIDGADKSDAPDDSKPFIYNGRTYVPLRYIGESMGKKVLWDGDTKSIYINDEGNAREDIPFASMGYVSSDDDIYLDSETNVVQLNLGVWGEGKNSITFNLNGLAKNVSGTVDMSDTEKNNVEGKVIFYDQNDKVLYQTPMMRNSTNPVAFDFSASGVLQLRVEFISNGSLTQICDIKIKDFRYSK